MFAEDRGINGHKAELRQSAGGEAGGRIAACLLALKGFFDFISIDIRSVRVLYKLSFDNYLSY